LMIYKNDWIHKSDSLCLHLVGAIIVLFDRSTCNFLLTLQPY